MIGIVFGSSMGNTEDAAKLISEGLGLENELLNVSDVDAAKLNSFDKLIL
ncbi:MAG: flavodoxin domain-containing protein, partial [Campylobacter sp.]|nr:flavodoxin domain-containing protein [Campylobacter sp.]